MVIVEMVSAMETELIACRRLLRFLLERSDVQLSESDFQTLKVNLQALKLNRVLAHCPFPHDCKEYEVCQKTDCNANECYAGYAYRRS
ncbi:MAG TPA: hypothetical protein PK659_07555 [Methanothrix sp.]|nr:hypothetical protein [Methanothrix sp.]HOL44088.1 hypothetical protein [Methanothrix sp.]